MIAKAKRGSPPCATTTATRSAAGRGATCGASRCAASAGAGPAGPAARRDEVELVAAHPGPDRRTPAWHQRKAPPARARRTTAEERTNTDMNVTDPIADMLTRIRNASAARHQGAEPSSSRMKREIARILAEEGFIEGFETQPDPVQDRLVLRLKYVEGRTPVVAGLKRISKPGLRVYARKTEIPRSRRPRPGHPLHLPRGDDGQRGPEAEPRRRGPLLRLVRSERMSRIGRMPIPLPDGVELSRRTATA